MNEPPLNPVEQKVASLISPFEKFVESQTSTGLLLVFATLLAMVMANTGMNDIYQTIIHVKAGLIFGDHQFKMSVEEWIGSGLMALFFFVLGLELKRECLAGELQNPKRIGIVLSAALGGMVMPAVIYYLINSGSSFQEGWAIPMATDTAFALGALAFFKRKVSKELFISLTGLA
ncbi:MAG: sodium:proton antiporter, partial [Nitrospinae bacterium CG22_combo_CG10-13_8_21_14_all_47_10]